ncbi:hypothetical protein [Kaistia defluvii]|uniref:Sulfotransferase family protein n=1 Tax=Kaistia defluvii TaxID=410841 RepID=A0ABV2QSY6_9HYPH
MRVVVHGNVYGLVALSIILAHFGLGWGQHDEAASMQTWAFHGMRRSGNHVVLNWSGLTESTFFMNDILQREQVPALLGDPFPTKAFLHWFPRVCARRYVRRMLRKTGWKLLTRGLCVSLEDWPIDKPIFTPWPRRCQHILLLRDPLNMFASRIRMSNGMHVLYGKDRADDYFQNSIELWKSHAGEFLGHTHLLPGHVGVYYDRWVVDAAYRAAIAARLRLVPDEGALYRVAVEGGGSSFEGLSPLGEDAIARRLSRHSQLDDREQKLLARVTDDAELMHLREQVLEHVSGMAERQVA